MRANDEIFYNLIDSLGVTELRDTAIRLYEENTELQRRQEMSERVNTEIYIQYNDMKNRYDRLEAECSEVKALLAREIEKNNLRAKSVFGRKTEGILTLLDSAENKDQVFEDESDTEDCLSEKTENRIILFDKKKAEIKAATKNSRKSCGSANRLKKSLENLPKQIRYDIDIEALNAEYGVGNWTIALWHEHMTLEKLSTPFYANIIYTPVVSSGLDHQLTTMPYENPLLDRTYASASILSDMYYGKYVLSLPYNRQSMDYRMNGIELSKQTILNWTSRIVPEVMEPVVERLTEVLLTYNYIQNDETRILVNKDQRGPGHQSFMWVHCSSEMLDCPPIIIFCYEATRNTDHLRRLFREFMGYLTCDAYISYQVLESESEGNINVTGCFMHCRRYFAEAFFINDVASMTEEDILAMPETRALFLIRDIYKEENPLSGMTSDDRKSLRDRNVRPKVDAFFDYVHELENSEIIYSERMSKAITYTINQEEHLRRFLEDGNICCDNGHAERVIRSFSVGRANWLFSDTVYGAEINATMYSIVETAKANGVNVRVYLQYLLEEVPKHKDDSTREYLDDMMPWSDAYHNYEGSRLKADENMLQCMFSEPVRPKASRKPLKLQSGANPPPRRTA